MDLDDEQFIRDYTARVRAAYNSGSDAVRGSRRERAEPAMQVFCSACVARMLDSPSLRSDYAFVTRIGSVLRLGGLGSAEATVYARRNIFERFDSSSRDSAIRSMRPIAEIIREGRIGNFGDRNPDFISNLTIMRMIFDLDMPPQVVEMSAGDSEVTVCYALRHIPHAVLQEEIPIISQRIMQPKHPVIMPDGERYILNEIYQAGSYYNESDVRFRFLWIEEIQLPPLQTIGVDRGAEDRTAIYKRRVTPRLNSPIFDWSEPTEEEKPQTVSGKIDDCVANWLSPIRIRGVLNEWAVKNVERVHTAEQEIIRSENPVTYTQHFSNEMKAAVKAVIIKAATRELYALGVSLDAISSAFEYRGMDRVIQSQCHTTAYKYRKSAWVKGVQDGGIYFCRINAEKSKTKELAARLNGREIPFRATYRYIRKPFAAEDTVEHILFYPIKKTDIILLSNSLHSKLPDDKSDEPLNWQDMIFVRPVSDIELKRINAANSARRLISLDD